MFGKIDFFQISFWGRPHSTPVLEFGNYMAPLPKLSKSNVCS